MKTFISEALRPTFGAVTRRQGLQWLATCPFLSDAQAAPTGVQLASDWSVGRSPQGFLVSEKFDGVRAVWNGRQLRFRSGREIVAPDWFVRALPQQPLDGELWFGRGQFDRLSGVVRQQHPPEAWQQVRYMVFDAPGLGGTFEARWQALQSVTEAVRQPWLLRVEQTRVDTATALQQWLDAIVRDGGEGLVLHRADALWQPGRTQVLFKFKPEPDDEAQVMSHLPGKGRYEGMTGALQVQTPEGVAFALGSGLSDAQRRNPPEVGSWVTYRYRDRTPQGIPRFASFVRARAPE
jgi:DNA ligase-1